MLNTLGGGGMGGYFYGHKLQSGKVGEDEEMTGWLRMGLGANTQTFFTLLIPLKTDMDDCASHLCKNNGTCTDRVNGFKCSCAPGFNGTQCETGNYIQCFILLHSLSLLLVL